VSGVRIGACPDLSPALVPGCEHRLLTKGMWAERCKLTSPVRGHEYRERKLEAETDYSVPRRRLVRGGRDGERI
jgi:hypothetical protein